MKSIFIGFAVLLLGVFIFIAYDKKGNENEDLVRTGESEDLVGAVRSPSAKSATKASKESAHVDRLLLKLGCDPSELNECTIDILKAFEFGNMDLVRKRLKHWLEFDEDLLLSSLDTLDNMEVVFGEEMEFPNEIVAQHLFLKYGGEEMMSKIASLGRLSNNNTILTSEAITIWGEQNLEEAFKFLAVNKNLQNPTAVTRLIEDRFQDGRAEEVLEYYDLLPEDHPDKPHESELYDIWVAQKPDQFAEFINSQDDVSAAENAIGMYAASAAESDVGSALEWADTIEDKDIKINVEALIAVSYVKQDPADFRKWYGNMHFESTERKALFDHLLIPQLLGETIPGFGELTEKNITGFLEGEN